MQQNTTFMMARKIGICFQSNIIQCLFIMAIVKTTEVDQSCLCKTPCPAVNVNFVVSTFICYFHMHICECLCTPTVANIAFVEQKSEKNTHSHI